MGKNGVRESGAVEGERFSLKGGESADWWIAWISDHRLICTH